MENLLADDKVASISYWQRRHQGQQKLKIRTFTNLYHEVVEKKL